MILRRWWGLLVLCGLLGCDRTFEEVEPPSITVTEPDLSLVQLAETIQLQVAATSNFRDVQRVTLDGQDLEYNAETDRWHLAYRLERGLNALIFEATDSADETRTDTSYALFTSYFPTLSPLTLQEGRGGHTTTRLTSGQLLIVGGTPVPGGNAVDTYYRVAPNESDVVFPQRAARAARVGHTATLLPDGRVLILGGSHTAAPENRNDLLTTALLFDPDNNSFAEIVTEGVPVRRLFHSAYLIEQGGEIFVDVVGGLGDSDSDANTLLVPRDDQRRFRFRNDSLIALDFRTGVNIFPDVEPLRPGLTYTPLQANAPASTRYLATGLGINDPATGRTYQITDDGINLFADPRRSIVEARTRHTANLLQTDFVLVLGGWQHEEGTVTDAPGLYVATVDRWFGFPEGPGLRPAPRYGHTATKFIDGLTQWLVIIGGYSPDGTAIAAAEYFSIELPLPQ